MAARLGNQQLENWILWESNGYPNNIEVPSYRVWPLQVKGHFGGMGGSMIKNAPIPMALIPKSVRNSYERYACRQSIASIEEVLANAKDGAVQVSTSDLALVLGEKVYQYQNCIQAWGEFGKGHLVELVNSVRNRILDFALAIWKEAPTAGESSHGKVTSLESTKITQIFNTVVHGGSANLVGTANASTVAFNIGASDFSSLERVLLENGVPKEDLRELRAALESEKEPKQDHGFGPKVSSWISKMMEKAADGSWNIGLGAAGNLLAQAIAKYYGL